MINGSSGAFVNFSQNAKTMFSPRSNGICSRKIMLHYSIDLLMMLFIHRKILTETIMDTMLFNMPSMSVGSPLLKQTSQTPMILCKSSSIPLFDFSSEISAPKLLRYRRNSWACKLITKKKIFKNTEHITDINNDKLRL